MNARPFGPGRASERFKGILSDHLLEALDTCYHGVGYTPEVRDALMEIQRQTHEVYKTCDCEDGQVNYHGLYLSNSDILNEAFWAWFDLEDIKQAIDKQATLPESVES